MPLKFYSAWHCPFAQRAWMTLLHKGLDFEYIEVDPYQESQWWLDISRQQAKVPVIVTPSITVIDSTRVVEYLEDLTPEHNPLFPNTPDEKAELRFWIDHINERIAPYIYQHLEAEQPSEYSDNSKAALIKGIEDISEAMSPSGAFFNGKTLNVIDVLLISFAYRIDVLLQHYRGFSLPTTGNTWARYARWYEAMYNTEIFQSTLAEPETYRQRLIEHYLPYSQGQK